MVDREGTGRSRSGSGSRRSRSGSKQDAAADPRFARPSKRVVLAGVRRSPLRVPDDAKRFGFETETGAPKCWRLASEPSERFAASGLRYVQAVFTRSSELHVYFPAFTRYFVVKSFQSRAGFTLARILKCIDTTAVLAMAYYIRHDLPSGGPDVKITAHLVRRLLRLYAMCALAIKGNHVYCITADV